MCKIMQKIKGNSHDLICSKTGKPITISNEHGMYCEERCGESKDKKIMKEFMEDISTLIETGKLPEKSYNINVHNKS